MFSLSSQSLTVTTWFSASRFSKLWSQKNNYSVVSKVLEISKVASVMKEPVPGRLSDWGVKSYKEILEVEVELKCAHIFDTLHSVGNQPPQDEPKMIAQFLVSCTIFFTLAKCESSETEVVAKPRFYIEGDSYTINLIPFFIALKIAFVLGKLILYWLRKQVWD